MSFTYERKQKMKTAAEKIGEQDAIPRRLRKPYSIFLGDNGIDFHFKLCCDGCRTEEEISIPNNTKDISCECGALYIVWRDGETPKMTCVTAPIFSNKALNQMDEEL